MANNRAAACIAMLLLSAGIMPGIGHNVITQVLPGIMAGLQTQKCPEPKSQGSESPTSGSPTTISPTMVPTNSPTSAPTDLPTAEPSVSPTTMAPTDSPTADPSVSPTTAPSDSPTKAPTKAPTAEPPSVISAGVTHEGSVYMSSQHDDHRAERCFDGNKGGWNFCHTYCSSPRYAGEWIEIDFGHAVLVTGVTMTLRQTRQFPLTIFVHNAGPHEAGNTYGHGVPKPLSDTANLRPQADWENDRSFDLAFQPETTCAFDCKKTGGCNSTQSTFPAGSSNCAQPLGQTCQHRLYTVTCEQPLVGRYVTIVGEGGCFDQHEIEVQGIDPAPGQ